MNFGVLKRIAEERAALLKAAGLPIDALPHNLVPRGWEASADGLSACAGSARNRRGVDGEPRYPDPAGSAWHRV